MENQILLKQKIYLSDASSLRAVQLLLISAVVSHMLLETGIELASSTTFHFPSLECRVRYGLEYLMNSNECWSYSN